MIADSLNSRMHKHRQISRVIKANYQAIEDMAKEHAKAAMDTLAEIAADKDAPSRDRIKAAAEILDRGFGRSVERTVIANLSDAGGSDYSHMTTRELLLLHASKLLSDPSKAEPGWDTPGTGFENGEY